MSCINWYLFYSPEQDRKKGHLVYKPLNIKYTLITLSGTPRTPFKDTTLVASLNYFPEYSELDFSNKIMSEYDDA